MTAKTPQIPVKYSVLFWANVKKDDRSPGKTDVHRFSERTDVNASKNNL